MGITGLFMIGMMGAGMTGMIGSGVCWNSEILVLGSERGGGYYYNISFILKLVSMYSLKRL